MIVRLLLSFRPVPAALALVLPLGAAITPETSKAAAGKLHRIATSALESGETIVLSEDELNSFLRYDGASGIPTGFTDVRVRLRRGGGSVEAVVNAEEAGLASEDAPLFVRLLARNARNVSADIGYEGRDGVASVKVVAVKVGGFTLSGAALDWFLEAFAPESLRPYATGKPVPLKGGLDVVRIMPDRIIFTAK